MVGFGAQSNATITDNLFLPFHSRNRFCNGKTNCLPSYLSKFGYKTIASQPLFGSFFNIEKAYKSIGFNESFLRPSFDMSDMNNGWLSDESFFNQHFQILKNELINKKPILNYVFTVGCHSPLGQSKSLEVLIEYPQSKILEQFLNCHAKSIYHLNEYINKILNIDPDSLIIILPDHFPPGITISSYKDAGYICEKNQQEFCDRRVRGIFIGNTIEIKNKNFGYYELPEIIINQVSDKALCKTIKCSTDTNYININGSILDREKLNDQSDQSLSLYHRELYFSLLRESIINTK